LKEKERRASNLGGAAIADEVAMKQDLIDAKDSSFLWKLHPECEIDFGDFHRTGSISTRPAATG
jgi:hypothetical protein